MKQKNVEPNSEIFSKALTLVDELTTIITKEPDSEADWRLHQEKIFAEAEKLIREQLITHAQSEEEIFLGAILIAQADFLVRHPSLAHRRDRREAVNSYLRNCINGDYFLYASYQGGSRDDPATSPLMSEWKTMSTSVGDDLSLCKITENELKKRYGQTGERLAKAMQPLLVNSHYTESSLKKLASILEEHGIDNFKNVKILEFGTGTYEIKNGKNNKEQNPGISSLYNIRDYTPSRSMGSFCAERKYVEIRKPGSFFSAAANMAESDKYDYITASNVFAHAAFSWTEYLLPLFANVLKDGGRLHVANTFGDGTTMLDISEKDPRKIEGIAEDGERFGLKGIARSFWREPSRDDYNSNALWEIERDYRIRPPIPYTLDDFNADHNSKREGRKWGGHVANIVEQQEKNIGGSWNMDM